MMGVESVSVAAELFHVDTLEIAFHFPTRELMTALESMESKRHIQAVEAIQRTFTYKTT